MKITDQDIIKAAKEIGVEPAALKSIAITESNGDGFYPDGKCKILFEGHIFWQQLIKDGVDPKQLQAQYPNIIYPTWDKTKYFGGEKEWQRLTQALTINTDAAYKSASYGMFQIMGFNFKACGCADITEFVSAMCQSEINQLRAVVSLISSNNWLIYLKNKDWVNLALHYNGPKEKDNNYDVKLAQNYQMNLDLNDL
jgi:hypothetical protein